jgi:ubiquinone/menaquinone biosynthesis C-methylase UbiE
MFPGDQAGFRFLLLNERSKLHGLRPPTPDAHVRSPQGHDGTTGRGDHGAYEPGCRRAELLNVRPDDKILEVGFGPGVAIQLLLQRLATGSVAGVDQSQEMVRQAAARNADALRNRRVDLRYGSAERLPFSDQTFDKALAINSMQAWPDARAGLREIWRVLKHDGVVAVGFTVNSGQPRQGVAESLAAAGFAQAHIVERSKLFCAIATKL